VEIDAIYLKEGDGYVEEERRTDKKCLSTVRGPLMNWRVN
jgi:hypothetical protein